MLELSPAIDVDACRARFARTGRARVEGLLAPASADRLHRHFAANPRWNLVTTHGGRHIDLDHAGMLARPEADRRRLEALAHEQARRGFGYLYCNTPLYDIAQRKTAPGLPLLEAYAFVNSAPFLSFVAGLTGMDDIAFADAQATMYLPGHFLTRHDDDVAGKNRRAAYVLSMTKDWRSDWGGLLQFMDADGRVTETFTPGFNALSVFAVPQAHAVSLVAPFAGAPRYAITGWLRAGVDPGPD